MKTVFLYEDFNPIAEFNEIIILNKGDYVYIDDAVYSVKYHRLIVNENLIEVELEKLED